MDVLNERGALSRDRVWLLSWLQVATSSSCLKPAVAASWADHCLAEFDKRFPPPKESVE